MSKKSSESWAFVVYGGIIKMVMKMLEKESKQKIKNLQKLLVEFLYSIYYFIKVGDIIDTINMINYSIMLVFFVCYAYQFLCIPISF